MIYANHAGTGWPKPPGVHDAIAAALAADPVEAAAGFETWRRSVCRFLGIRDPDRLLFTTGCTSALAAAFSDLALAADDVVLTSALEHHALARPVARLVASRGVRHLVAPWRSGEPIDLDRVREVLRGGRVRLVATTHASNVTGELLPVAQLARLAHEHGALFLLDAAQSVGVVPVDAERLGVDLLTFAGHKGPLGPHGIGGLWAAPHVPFETPGAVCEIGGTEGPPRCAAAPGYCDVGSVNIAGLAGLAAGMDWHEQRGLERTGGHARALASELVEQLRTRGSCTVYGGDGERTAAVSIRVDGLPLDRAEAHFREHGIVVRAGQHCAPMALEAIGAPQGTVRISFGPSNERSDVDAVLRAIDDATASGL